MNLSVLLWGMPQAMRAAARLYPEYAARLKERNLVAQFRLRDRPEGRWIQLDNGKVSTGKGLHASPDLTLHFQNRAIAEEFLTPGQVYEFEIDLWETCIAFNAGHRIRVDISSSNFPRFDVNPNTGEPLNDNRRMISAVNTIYHDRTHPSHIVLPVIPK